MVTVFPAFNLAFGLVFANTVVFLNFADQLVTLAGDIVQTITAQLALLLLDFAFWLVSN